MRRVRVPLLLLLASASLAHGQIYADFTVAQGSTTLGTFRARLDHDKAPRTCANFIGLATGRRPWVRVTTGELVENTPYYNGQTFHRLIHNFVIQGGSPNGQGTDSPGYAILDEYHASLRHTGRYFLSMAKASQPNTGGSQFFITLEATPSLDDKHSIFGEVISGRAIVDSFTNPANFPTDRTAANAGPSDPGYSDRPVTPITITNVVISGPDYAAFDLDAPALKLPIQKGIALVPKRNAAASTFSIVFDRGAGHEYHNSHSTDLRTWTPFRHYLSLDESEEAEISFTSVTFPKFFMRMIDTDYSFLNNAPADLNKANRKLRITSRAGNWVELTLGGGTTGTWTASNSTSGSLSAVSWSDSAPSTGLYSATGAQARFVPLGVLSATFSSPAGTDAWTSLNSVYLSFHGDTSGWVEGSATVSGSPIPGAVNRAFTITP
ncbi:peptidylprolyl isomerase [Luteolibacter flavescens]|uniref:peptidylprolyl isomerase n=1 Tax=Luteolibacter flavescens TaxID=1859460 RepID=A0ABT3FLI3_9BACT|nr:peptidylprolyl isomerase [Luteolibacter flavescens]MCW1884430.1 peptidylprolyl isomerase [Luteolibacter flavescens]